MRILFVYFFFLLDKRNSVESVQDGYPCNSSVYCYGPLLDAVQRLNVFPHDSKWFVDLPMKASPDKIQVAFADLGPADELTLPVVRDFVAGHFFLTPENELEIFQPIDWKPITEGGLLIRSNITDKNYKQVAEEIHKTWLSLGRRVSEHVHLNPERHSLIGVPYPFIIPGGRFREVYYWDSFWVIQGLLVSGMAETAKGMIYNFKHLMDRLGHIPNGNRVYYEKRSQPPFLALMVDAYVRDPSIVLEDKTALANELLPVLEKEYDFWMSERAVTFSYKGQKITLNLFKGGITQPRPESYREDVHEALKLKDDQKGQFWANIAAAAESGWDFSSRWVDDPAVGLTSIRTESIIPVDLNAIICAQLRIISELYQMIDNPFQAEKYRVLAKVRADILHSVFWVEEKDMWRDFDLKTKVPRKDFYLSHVTPVYARCSGSVDIMSTEFLNKVLNSEDIKKVTSYSGGFPASLVPYPSKLQWDFPNAWPPSQLMLIEGFANNPDTRATAVRWAQTWINVVHTAFLNNKTFYEKYNSEQIGGYGGGGEYQVQEGFGWTNGGILRLLQLFPTDLSTNSSAITPGSRFLLLLLSAILAIQF